LWFGCSYKFETQNDYKKQQKIFHGMQRRQCTKRQQRERMNKINNRQVGSAKKKLDNIAAGSSVLQLQS
jgi:transcription initiation factor TFIIIB Brf1 subunit/transcription initiation factor TFIIB